MFCCLRELMAPLENLTHGSGLRLSRRNASNVMSDLAVPLEILTHGSGLLTWDSKPSNRKRVSSAPDMVLATLANWGQ